MRLSLTEKAGILICIWVEFSWLTILTCCTPAKREDLFYKYNQRLEILERITDKYFPD